MSFRKLATCLLILLLMPATLNAEPEANCKISLQELSAESGTPGSLIKLFGEFGEEQGPKIPVINMGSGNTLEIVSWSSRVIVARIPEGLMPGVYKIGIYCRSTSYGSTAGSGFKSFEVLSGASNMQRLIEHSKKLKDLTQEKKPEGKGPGTKATSVSTTNAQSNDWQNYILFSPILLFLLILVLRNRQLKNPGVQAIPLQEKTTAIAGKCAGIPFTAQSLSAGSITVSIDAVSDQLKQSCQLSLDNGIPIDSPPAINSAISKLLKLKVIYLDIGYNTDQILAELKGDISKFDEDQAKAIARYLIEIKKILS